jgi:hypothetical protein
MASQTAGNVLAALKRETTMGTAAAAGAGAKQIRIVDSPGLRLERGEILSAERRGDQLRPMGRLGSKNTGGSYSSELSVGGAMDDLFESIVRGTWGALASVPSISTTTQLKMVRTPAVPIYHSYTIEQYDVDIDASELFLGTRVTRLEMNLQPNAHVTLGWTFQGLDRQVLSPAQSPYFTNPTVTSGLSLVADDSTIRYKGSEIVRLTGMTLNFEVNAALQPVIGRLVSPDVFMNMMTITGSVTAIRQDLLTLNDFDAETEFELLAVLSAPGTGARDTFAVQIPRAKISGIDAPFLGGDAAKVETWDLMVGPTADSTGVRFYSSGNTATAV